MKNRISSLLCALSLAFSSFSPVNAQTDGTFFTHEVRAGETLYGIARMYGVTPQAVRDLNPGMGETLLTGRRIKVPQSGGGDLHHTIRAGETLYGIIRKYGISAEALCGANPGLSASNFRAGEVIIIPLSAAGQLPAAEADTVPGTRKKGCKLMYRVRKKETIYSIAKKFNVTEAELLGANPDVSGDKIKKNQVLCIPYSAEEVYAEPRTEDIIGSARHEAKRALGSINAAVILPFNLSRESLGAESMKMIDFYEGFLLAADSLKTGGLSVNIYAYDESSSMEDVLGSPMMKHMDVIFGPMEAGNIGRLSKFAEENGACLVVPFSSKDFVANNAKNVFQVNVSQSSIQAKIYERFAEENAGANIIFVGMNDRNDRTDYITGFKKALEARGVGYSRLDFASLDELPGMLKPGGRNIIIPSAASQNAFETLTRELDALTEIRSSDISLFGYPEWQAFTSKADKNLAKYACTFYSTFYNNEESQRSRSFDSKFRRWFKREQYNSYPKYAMLGYDLGVYFLKGLHEQGGDFMTSAPQVDYTSLQNPLRFRRKNNWSGFVNNSVIFVRYRNDGTKQIKIF